MSAPASRTTTFSSRWDSASMSLVFGCGIVLPTDEYTTTLNYFPSTNCHQRWKLEGDFYTTIAIYNSGKKQGEIAVGHCTETGYLSSELTDIAQLTQVNCDGLLMMETFHTNGIPLDIYMFHTHTQTGSYVSYPVATYIGDRIFTEARSQYMENTLFWPGVAAQEHSESEVAIMNPYKLPMSYEISVFLPHGERLTTKVLKTRPLSHSIYKVEELFPQVSRDCFESGGVSLCITAQFKLIAYFLIRNRRTGIYTTIDHLHQYCLF